MTLINFSSRKKDGGLSRYTVIFIATALLLAVVFLYHYNTVVDLKFDIRSAHGALEEAQENNAEHKVELHGLLSPQKIDDVVRASGLVKETNPRYLTDESIEVAANTP